jgi:hypothetical protein
MVTWEVGTVSELNRGIVAPAGHLLEGVGGLPQLEGELV